MSPFLFPAQQPGAAHGVGLEAGVKWNGILVFGKVTTLLGLIEAERSWQLLDPKDMLGPRHWVWVPFAGEGVK